MGDHNTALFPLSTVLFPGGLLPLRIFEPRYLSMVGHCMKHGQPFGVVLIKEGSEAGGEATFHDIGTLARIMDFDQLDDGMLSVTCRGEQIFSVEQFETQSDQLVVGRLSTKESVDEKPVEVDFQPLSDFLFDILEREELQSYREGLSEDWTSANWLGYRLAELLPLPMTTKQELLELDTLTRLSRLKAILIKHKLI